MKFKNDVARKAADLPMDDEDVNIHNTKTGIGAGGLGLILAGVLGAGGLGFVLNRPASPPPTPPPVTAPGPAQKFRITFSSEDGTPIKVKPFLVPPLEVGGPE